MKQKSRTVFVVFSTMFFALFVGMASLWNDFSENIPNLQLAIPQETILIIDEKRVTPTGLIEAISVSPSLTFTPFQPESNTRTPDPTPSKTSTLLVVAKKTTTVEPTAEIPLQARITNIWGRMPTYSLDCEARSAVDWARYYGVEISEYAFQNTLPISDNPDKGFVGSVYGVWGQLPPQPYGVHAEPVAKLLRTYGVNAKPLRGMQWDELRKEIVGGNPVIVWVVGRVLNGAPISYQSVDGHETIVARYEHTVIVIGYSQTSVTVLDGGWIYQRSIKQFLDSWGVLGNMAIVYDE